jgi:hypothetical protein
LFEVACLNLLGRASHITKNRCRKNIDDFYSSVVPLTKIIFLNVGSEEKKIG